MTKVTRVDSMFDLTEPQKEGILIEFDGEKVYFTYEDIESHLKKYLNIRKKLKKEKSIRKANETVNEAYEQYRALLLLAK